MDSILDRDSHLRPAEDLLRIDVEHQGAAARVGLSGELDLSTAPELRTVLGGLWGDEPLRHLELDLGELSFIDSTGLETLLRAEAKARRSGCQFKVVRAPPHVHRVFVITGLDRWLGTSGDHPD